MGPGSPETISGENNNALPITVHEAVSGEHGCHAKGFLSGFKKISV